MPAPAAIARPAITATSSTPVSGEPLDDVTAAAVSPAVAAGAASAEVTVAARDVVKRTQAEMLGCRSMPFTELEAAAGKFDVICNTVPAKVVTESVLKKIQKDALILDLASKPGGINLEAAQKIGRRVIWALSLPGKTAPVTAGEIIAKTILHILEERRITDA